MFTKKERVISLLEEGIFNTVKTNIPDLLNVSETILIDVRSGKQDTYLVD